MKSAVISRMGLSIVLCVFALISKAQHDPDLNYCRSLIGRLLPKHTQDFLLVKIPSDNGRDIFGLDYANHKIVLRGNNNNSLATALNYYLKYYCHTSVSWFAADPIEVPVSLPPVLQPVKQIAKVKARFFLNYCTFGYTMPWWQWKDWERFIDWMALNGINMPLAITGQEAIWYKVWKKFGLTDIQIRSYFTGPAHLPWHRMSNLDHWQGPLPTSYMDQQLALQKKILAREREFNMTPVLPAFGGHVPEAIKPIYPHAKINTLGEWGGFPDKYRSFFLDPLDPLFDKIQTEFLQEEIKQFGSDHIYGTDPFNEVKPPSWEPAYLATVSKTIYESIKKTDQSATWVMMAWIFYFERDHWTNDRISAFVKAVPQNKMLLLDYYCENEEVWKLTNSFFDQPYCWCYLGNFGGNTMLAGNLDEVNRRIENVFLHGGKNLWGLGSTLEALDVNPLLYEFVFEKAWQAETTISNSAWIAKWAERRNGAYSKSVNSAWQILLNKIYQYPTSLGQATLTNARPSLTGNGNWTTNPAFNYSNRDLMEAWKLLLEGPAQTRNSFEFDVVNIGRQVLGNYFLVLRDSFSASYNNKDVVLLRYYGKKMILLLEDMDKLLSTNSNFLLGKWLANAKLLGRDETEKKYYEENARVIITTWGTKAQSLNDYANRSWAGLMKGYYRNRWKMFIDSVISSVQQKQPFDEKKFFENVTAFEIAWTKGHELYADKPVGNCHEIAKSLSQKYSPAIGKNLK